MLRITDIKETGTRDIKADNKAVRDSIIKKKNPVTKRQLQRDSKKPYSV